MIELPEILNLPPKLLPFLLNIGKYRYYLADGGRGSGKSQAFARIILYIAEKKIVIEIDGKQHTSPEHKEADEQRDKFLANWNISVLRYSNESIRNNFRAVAEDILKNLELDYKDLKPL